jgi:AraC-like DNA-binding protein
MTATTPPHGKSKSDLPPVATFLTPDERLRVDAAGMGVYQTHHRDSIDQIVRDLQTRRIGAVLLSANICEDQGVGRIARIVREYPRIPTVAVVSQYLPRTAQAVLLLGRCGIRTLVDVRDSRGWQELRGILDRNRTGSFQRLAIGMIETDLGDASSGCRHFFQVLFELAPKITTVRALAEILDVVPSTLMSRFFRFRLPAPKRYLAVARLTCAAQLFENPGLSVAAVSNQLDFSSPQSFGRHVYAILQMTPSDFRESYDGEGMLEYYRRELILPYMHVLQRFDPLAA